ncbi:MAG: hypothetical protein EHM85_05885 [Desulfobacteraceae bacterium]|nr:MAG: hypothetical protein EHM85_05885 [Desulfobacteraceae bacterium]
MNQEAKSAVVNQWQERPFPKGYPYLVIRIVKSLFHINVLSAEQNNSEELLQLAQTQADANKLDVCLVTNENAGVYFAPKQKPRFSEEIPKGGIFIKDRLRLSVDQPVGTDLLRRESELETFIKSTKQTGYLTGDLRKGAREATQEELICLQGVQENGLPKGLVICSVCGDYRGECLDPSQIQQGLVVRVSCYCENDNLCAYCGGKLNDRKLNSNHYETKDGKIWHTPGFSGLGHRCSGASNNV